jgi:hypothetical protein
LVHGNPEIAVEDVWGIGKAIGVKYKGDKMNRFNLLSRAGRREWRAAGGVEVVISVATKKVVGGDDC